MSMAQGMDKEISVVRNIIESYMNVFFSEEHIPESVRGNANPASIGAAWREDNLSEELAKLLLSSDLNTPKKKRKLPSFVKETAKKETAKKDMAKKDTEDKDGKKKRATSMYDLFRRDERETLIREGDMTPKEIISEISKRWKIFRDDTTDDTSIAERKLAYKKELDVKPSSPTKSPVKRDQVWAQFVRTERPKAKKSNPRFSAAEITSELEARWKNDVLGKPKYKEYEQQVAQNGSSSVSQSDSEETPSRRLTPCLTPSAKKSKNPKTAFAQSIRQDLKNGGFAEASSRNAEIDRLWKLLSKEDKDSYRDL